jgi:hypothetical protein
MAAIIRASHAISFHLLNPDGQSVIGIFDGNKGQTSTLEIINSSRRDLKLKKLEGAEATAANHHFELKFRPGTLSLSSEAPITVDAGTAGWRISKPTETDGGVSLYLLSTNPVALGSGNRTAVKLNRLNADGSGGSRGTRVELKWGEGRLEYVADGTQPEPLVAGHRVQHVTIVNERGDEKIPLHVSFVGTNQVVNDSSENTLTLRLTNQLKQGKVELIPEKHPEFPPSTFILSFDASVNEEWTISSPSIVSGFKVKAVAGGKEFNVREPQQGQSPHWTFWPKELISLGPGASLDVTISKIKTLYQPGPTNLYLHYKNIPGYWDGDFVEVVEKTPLFYLRDGSAVGVGTNTPKAKLHVAGKLLVDKDLSVGEKATVDKLRVEKEISVGGSGVVLVDATNVVGGRLKIDTEGKIGIGTNDPKAKLHVNGKLRVENEVSVGGTGVVEVDAPLVPGGRLKILSDGNVGIGTIDPKEKLHVGGNLRIKGDQEIFFEENGQIRSVDNNHRILFRRSEQKLELREYGSIIFSPGATEGKETAKVVITDGGFVGIGTSDPKNTLHVVGGLRVENEVSVGGEFDFDVDARGVKGGRLKVKQNGLVGIGTHDPTKARLEVSGQVGTQVNGYGFLNKEGASSTTKRESPNFSIWASDRIAAVEFNAFSDERMKNIQGRSDSATDLRTLLGIAITDYCYKDVIGKGNGTYKKVIGQQIEKVFPQAVSRVTDVVPDIYQQASIQDGWVALATELKKGERVKLNTENGEGLYEVLEVTRDKFRVAFDHEEDKVFVFGREVNDFLTVDYDAIAVLNVSATQQLKKEMDQEVKALRVENADLRAANDALAQRLQLLESKLEAVLGVMSATNGTNGNGRH